MILILLTALTENFQQSLMALAVNRTVITKLTAKNFLLTVKKPSTAQRFTIEYSINGVNDEISLTVQKHRRQHLKHQNA